MKLTSNFSCKTFTSKIRSLERTRLKGRGVETVRKKKSLRILLSEVEWSRVESSSVNTKIAATKAKICMLGSCVNKAVLSYMKKKCKLLPSVSSFLTDFV